MVVERKSELGGRGKKQESLPDYSIMLTAMFYRIMLQALTNIELSYRWIL
jgi:hypothetical protein